MTGRFSDLVSSLVATYEEKIEREKNWYREPVYQAGHFLNSRLFCSQERMLFSAGFCQNQLAQRIRQILVPKGLQNPRMLVAPTGAGYDLPYLKPLSNRIVGIDISSDALKQLPEWIEKHVGDIKNMSMFPDGTFDVVVMSEFFHHFLKFGFDEFLREARRVLRPGGHLFAMEPSILHPVAAAAWCGKKLFGNITGCVEDESPFGPRRLLRAMHRCGFTHVTMWSGSYSHHRMPVPLARFIHFASFPFLGVPVLRHFGWNCVFYGNKPMPQGPRCSL